MRKKIQSISALIIIVVLGLIFQLKHLNDFPSHIHSWAQSDRYALSLGFVDNDLNFFKPQTFVYNHQFPNNYEMQSKTTITAVDFPIHDYIPALFMKIFGNNSPIIFRLYILLYSFIGLYFLFKLALLATNDYIKSIFVLIFAGTSPLFLYYQSAFLPTIPSLSNAIIGVFFYYKYINDFRSRYFNLSLLFFTLATLSRTTFAIPIIAIFCVEFIRIIKKETRSLPKIIPLVISFSAIFSYMLYNNYLRNNYGSMFLNYVMPATSLEQTKEIIKYVYETWFFHYFSKFHYLAFFAISIVFLYSVFFKKININKPKTYFFLFSFTYLFGCFLFSLLMLTQFRNHDYYFLDTFFLPIILLLVFILSPFLVIKRPSFVITFSIVVIFFALIFIFKAIKIQEKRRESGIWDRVEITKNNFQNSSSFLDSIHIPKSAKILVIDATAPNIPFILMQRKGFAVMTTSKENIENSLKWNYDYIVFQNDYFISDIYTPYPDVLSSLDKIADNGKITVCKFAKNKKQSLMSFLGLEVKKPIFNKIVTFDEAPDSLWTNFKPNANIAYNGNFSGYLSINDEYGLTCSIKNLYRLEKGSNILLFSSYLFSNLGIDCEVVVSISSNGQNDYYKSFNLKDLVKKKAEWEQISLVFQLPKIIGANSEILVYLWNVGKSELYYDNFEVSIF